MTCFKPKIAKWTYFNKINENTGEVYATKEIKFIPLQNIKPETAFKKNTIIIPCGQCAGCLCDKANDWSTRCYLESTLHKKNCFVTLTYNNEHLPKNRSLCKEDIQKFFKKLRHEQKEPIKYLLSGEYGPTTLRPHYHAAIFNYKPNDLKFYKYNSNNDMLFTSERLSKIWGKGYVIIGDLNYKTAAYVARYVLKKAYGINKEWNTKRGRIPEFNLSSRRPAICAQIPNTALWEKIKRNNGVFIKTNDGVFLKPIPHYLKNKWKEFNREEYFQNQDQQDFKRKEIAKKADTTKSYWELLKEKAEKFKNQIKRLDKRNNL